MKSLNIAVGISLVAASASWTGAAERPDSATLHSAYGAIKPKKEKEPEGQGGLPAEFPAHYFFSSAADPACRDQMKLVGKPAPDIKLATAHGKEADALMQGKVVVVYIWATWCPHCIEFIPMANENYKKYKDSKDVVFASICENEGLDKLSRTIKDKGIEYPVAKDTGGKLAKLWRVVGSPTIAVVDRKGIVRAIHLSPTAIDPVVDKLVKEPAAPPAVPGTRVR